MDELLVKYLLGEADGSERQAVEVWLRAEEENSRYFEGFKTIWEESKVIQSVTAVDENEAWKRFQSKIAGNVSAGSIPFVPAKKRRPLALAAALIAVIIGGAFAAYFFSNRNNGLHFESGDQVLACNLPDGSTVTLNRHAVLDYKKDRENGQRRVQLKGEGFFEVAPDKAHPFIITAGDAAVKVVGTSFNVKSTDDETEVAVETGVVDVSKNNHSVLLLRNERAIVTRDSKGPRKFKSTDNLYNYYRSKEIVCNGTPLYHIINMLNEAYGTDITIANPAIKDLPLNTTIPAGATLDNILEMISGTLNIRIERNGDHIILQ